MITTLLFIFVVGSIFGWLFEFVVRSIKKGKIINPGYLKGFYLPIYGTGAILIYLISLLDSNIWIKLLLISGATTLLEFLTGLVLEKKGISLWKYKKSNSITYKGIICIKCSIIWIIFGYLFINYLLPIIENIDLFTQIFLISIIFPIISIDYIIKISK